MPQLSSTTRNVLFVVGGTFLGAGVATIYHRRTQPATVVSIPCQPCSRAAPPATALTPFTNVSVPSERHFELLKYGLPQTCQLQLKQNYVSVVDFERRIPRFVIEHLNKENLKGKDGVDRNGLPFTEDKDIHPLFRARNEDYAKSGYSRGHMSPASNNKSSMTSMKESFLLSSNIVPQELDNNMYYWQRMEAWVKHLAIKKGFEDVWVISGPLFLPSPYLPMFGSGSDQVIDVEPVNVTDNTLSVASNTSSSSSSSAVTRRSYSSSSVSSQSPSDIFTPPPSVPSSSKSTLTPGKPFKQISYKLIGDSNVAVPTHIFKAVLAERKPTKPNSTPELYFAAFIVPNTPIAEFLPLSSFKVSKDTLEKYSGCRIFDKAFDRFVIKDLCMIPDPDLTKQNAKESGMCTLGPSRQYK